MLGPHSTEQGYVRVLAHNQFCSATSYTVKSVLSKTDNSGVNDIDRIISIGVVDS